MPSTKQQKYRLARMRAAGLSPFTDGDVVRAHLAVLIEAGLNPNRISALSGVCETTIRRALGMPSEPPSGKVRRELADRILAVRPGQVLAAPAGLVDATGTHRRIQALVACGWSQCRIAARLGLHQQRVGQILAEQAVQAATAIAVAALYDEIWDVPPPEHDHRSRIAASRARRYAAARGWPRAAAWDDDEIDHPAAHPHGVIRPGRRSGESVVAEVADLARFGITGRAEVADRLGMSRDALEKALSRWQDRVAS